MLLFKLTISFFLLVVFPFGAPPSVMSIDPVRTAINSGSSSDLAAFFDSSISLNINGQQGDYSKSQAELVMKDFFRKNPPISFNIVFKSESNPSLSSYIGDYQSSQGLFKVMIKVAHQNNSPKIYSLEFVKG
jgi:hypothetical protein